MLLLDVVLLLPLPVPVLLLPHILAELVLAAKLEEVLLEPPAKFNPAKELFNPPKLAEDWYVGGAEGCPNKLLMLFVALGVMAEAGLL